MISSLLATCCVEDLACSLRALLSAHRSTLAIMQCACADAGVVLVADRLLRSLQRRRWFKHHGLVGKAVKAAAYFLAF